MEMIKMKNLEDLENVSFRLPLEREILVANPGTKRNGSVTYKSEEMTENSYTVKAGVIAFFDEGGIFTIPQTLIAMSILEEAKFRHVQTIRVPYVNGSGPFDKAQFKAWQMLMQEAASCRVEEFRQSCLKAVTGSSNSYYHQQVLVSEELLETRCFLIDERGVNVRLKNGANAKYTPAIPWCYFEQNKERLRTYNLVGSYLNGATCVFIHADGLTYVTKSKEVINELLRMEYKRDKSLFVPFVEKEHIMDKAEFAYWMTLSRLDK